MPIYVFLCQKCKNKFSLVATFEEYDRKEQAKFKCPKCGSREVKQLIESVHFIQTGKKLPCSCGRCPA